MILLSDVGMNEKTALQYLSALSTLLFVTLNINNSLQGA